MKRGHVCSFQLAETQRAEKTIGIHANKRKIAITSKQSACPSNRIDVHIDVLSMRHTPTSIEQEHQMRRIIKYLSFELDLCVHLCSLALHWYESKMVQVPSNVHINKRCIHGILYSMKCDVIESIYVKKQCPLYDDDKCTTFDSDRFYLTISLSS